MTSIRRTTPLGELVSLRQAMARRQFQVSPTSEGRQTQTLARPAGNRRDDAAAGKQPRTLQGS